MLQLAIGNKNYSSWSMRPWVLMTQAGIPFEERVLRFDTLEVGSPFKLAAGALSPTAQVPVLLDDGFAVWDTLAIAETLAERFPDLHLWPADARQRARARSVCAEMHGGFRSLRNFCAMNIEADLRTQGAILWRDQPGVRADVARIDTMWCDLLDSHGGPMLFGGFSIADAYFAPVCMRLAGYGLPISPAAAAYAERVRALPAVQAWVAGALDEHDFVQVDEPYRVAR